MAATIEQRYRDLSGGQNSRSIGYIVRGATDDIDALDTMETDAPLTYDGMARDGIEIEEVAYNNGAWVYFTRANYSRVKRQVLQAGESEYNFSIGTQTRHVVQSYETVAKYVPLGATEENFAKAIAVDSDNVPQGVDILAPISTFEVRIVLANATVSSAYQKTVRDLVGKTNNATFYSHAAGEVLFMGCAGSKRSGEDWELSYQFQTSPNQTGLTIGDITGIDVKGWEVIWVRYKTDVSDANRFIQVPTQVNVERVYESGNFATLGIGT